MMKRGRLSAIERLPVIADAAVARAIAAVAERRLTQEEAREALNIELSALGGIKPISHSAFNRWVIKGLSSSFAPRSSAAICPRCGSAIVGTAERRP
jgi:hypothetical protein